MNLIKIGNFLKELRQEKGYTQEKLGELLGISGKTISRWETGTYLPPVEMLQLLSTTYAVSINELLSGERLSEAAYKENAENNLKEIIGESAFTLKERTAFFKRKWKKGHAFSIVLCIILVIAVFVAGFFYEKWLLAAAPIIALSLYIFLYNRMMIYVERNAYRRIT